MKRALLLGMLASALALPWAITPAASFGAAGADDGCGIREAPGTLRPAASDKGPEEKAEPSPEIARELEKALQDLIEELKGVEKDAREKIQKEILPRVRKEIRKLREQLRDWELKEEEKEPPDTRSI